MEGVFLLLVFVFYIAIRLLFWLAPDVRQKDRKHIKPALDLIAHRAYQPAIPLLTDYLRQKPKSIETLLARAKCYYELDEPLLALADCTRATNLDNHLPTAYMLKGKSFLAMDHLEEALAEFEKAVWYDRENPEPITFRGLVWRRMGKEHRAQADLALAASMGDENAHYYLRKTEHLGIWK
jgi:tetratricopeptide (TPR) repeat protein